MKLYSHYGFQDFILCLGYKGEAIRNYIRKSAGKHRSSGKGSDSETARVEMGEKSGDHWSVTLVDTGLETNTGGRLKRIEPLIEGETFLATYADGLADLDLARLYQFHLAHKRLGTLTAVNPVSPFGELGLDGSNLVTHFREKPRLQHWINGGFFVFHRAFFRYLEENSVLEQAPLERLAAEGQLVAYRHEGFWACMDTYKDNVRLNELWQKKQAAWRVWK
jgi:glucose-1-phosphate cytidylyltransferase